MNLALTRCSRGHWSLRDWPFTLRAVRREHSRHWEIFADTPEALLWLRQQGLYLPEEAARPNTLQTEAVWRRTHYPTRAAALADLALAMQGADAPARARVRVTRDADGNYRTSDGHVISRQTGPVFAWRIEHPLLGDGIRRMTPMCTLSGALALLSTKSWSRGFSRPEP